MRNEHLQSDFTPADQNVFSQSAPFVFDQEKDHSDQNNLGTGIWQDGTGRPGSNRRKIKIEKQLTCPSVRLIKTLAKIENILRFMEQPELDPGEAQPIANQASAAVFNRQLELEFDEINVKRNQQNDLAIDSEKDDQPNINRENLKILTMVTTEITEALTKHDRRITITKLDVDDALRLARNIKKQLARRKIALATEKTDARTGVRLKYKLA